MGQIESKNTTAATEAVQRVIAWINQAESRALQIEGAYSDSSRVDHLRWMKNTLLSAPTEELQCDLLNHWTETGALPPDLLKS